MPWSRQLLAESALWMTLAQQAVYGPYCASALVQEDQFLYAFGCGNWLHPFAKQMKRRISRTMHRSKQTADAYRREALRWYGGV
jgi:hypothetical protein